MPRDNLINSYNYWSDIVAGKINLRNGSKYDSLNLYNPNLLEYSIKDIKKNAVLTSENIWVKRPGNGEISAGDYFKIINKKVLVDIKKDQQLKWEMIG